MSDAAWAILAPLFGVRDLRKGGRPRVYSDRLVLDTILYVVRSGCQWRMIPADLAPWWVAYRWYQTWKHNGTWQQVHDALRDQVRISVGKDRHPTAAIIDAQSIKTSEGGMDRGYDAGKKTTGRKRHIVVDTLGMLLSVLVTSASVQDRDGARTLLAPLAARFPSITLIWADGGYTGKLVSWVKEHCSILLTIIKRSDTTTGFQLLAHRWVVERTFGWLIRHRRLARDYERHPTNCETMITIAMISLMAHRLAKHKT